jgi:hypothetical protein
VNLLAVLEQNSGTDWRKLLSHVSVSTETNPDLASLPDDGTPGIDGADELTSLRI